MTTTRTLYLSLCGAALFALSAAFGAWATPAADSAECDSRCVRDCLRTCESGDLACETNCYADCGCLL